VGVGAVERLTITDDTPFVTEMQEFTSALLEGRAPRPCLEEAEVALGAVLAIYESAACRQPIYLREFLGTTLSPRT
jgi:predicted dehydrogenase